MQTTITLKQVKGGKKPWVAFVGPSGSKPQWFVDGQWAGAARSGNTNWEFEITEPGRYRVHEEWYGKITDEIIDHA